MAITSRDIIILSDSVDLDDCDDGEDKEESAIDAGRAEGEEVMPNDVQ